MFRSFKIFCLSKTVFWRNLLLWGGQNSVFLVYLFSIFVQDINSLNSSSFFLFIKVVSLSNNFRFLEIMLSSFWFLAFSNAVMYLLFANLLLLRESVKKSYSWTLILLELMWSYTICWETKDFSCKLSTNTCLLMLNSLLIALLPWERTKMMQHALQKLIYFWFL